MWLTRMPSKGLVHGGAMSRISAKSSVRHAVVAIQVTGGGPRSPGGAQVEREAAWSHVGPSGGDVVEAGGPLGGAVRDGPAPGDGHGVPPQTVLPLGVFQHGETVRRAEGSFVGTVEGRCGH